MKSVRFICEIFRKFPVLLLSNIILLIVVSFFSTCSMFAIGPVVDFLINPDLQKISPLTQKAINFLIFLNLPVTLYSWLIVLTIIIALNSIFQIFANWSILKTKYTVAWDIMHSTFKEFFGARWHFFTSGKQGVMLNTFGREIIVVVDAFSAMAQFFANLLQMIFFLAVPFYLSWKVTIISLVIALVFALPLMLLGKFSYRLGNLNVAASNKMASILHESFALAKIILGFGNQERSRKNLEMAFDDYSNLAIKSQILHGSVPLLYRPLSIVVISVALIASRALVVPLSETLVLLLSLQQVAAAIGIIAMQKSSLENFFPSYEQIESLKKKARELKQESGALQFNGFSRELILDNITFAYPGHKAVLVNIRARIPKGKMVAFVGESGVGKSTLIDLVMGFHQPTGGRILFDGVALTDFDIQSYRSRIGYVPQDSVLFNMSIKDNLLWAFESATDAKIKEACRQANADEFIERLREGYDTLVGDRGIRLSGGQVQRIALARAILRKPELLILDEATSSLDSYSEKLIQEAIENIAKETTVIVIAHRLSTIMKADFIYVLEQGRIIEEGMYSDLIKLEGRFNQMVRLQALETA